MAASRRFTAFVDSFRDKIRKKLRITPDPASLLDLRLELATAYLLLQERRLSVAYEPQPPGQSRGPDFAVTYTTSMTFMVEVTRLRAEVQEPSSAAPAPESTRTNSLLDERLADTVGSKLGQLLAQHSNVLLVGVESLPLSSDDLRAAMVRLQQRVESNDASILQRYRFRDRADFFRHYQRLSEIVVRGSDWQAAAATAAWANPQAKQPLPGKVRAALYRSHGV
jgi:hypothetical protein